MLRFSVIVANVKRVAMAQYSYNFFFSFWEKGDVIFRSGFVVIAVPVT